MEWSWSAVLQEKEPRDGVAWCVYDARLIRKMLGAVFDGLLRVAAMGRLRVDNGDPGDGTSGGAGMRMGMGMWLR